MARELDSTASPENTAAHNDSARLTLSRARHRSQSDVHSARAHSHVRITDPSAPNRLCEAAQSSLQWLWRSRHLDEFAAIAVQIDDRVIAKVCYEFSVLIENLQGSYFLT